MKNNNNNVASEISTEMKRNTLQRSKNSPLDESQTKFNCQRLGWSYHGAVLDGELYRVSQRRRYHGAALSHPRYHGTVSRRNCWRSHNTL
jgi:hypothetical protein